MVTRPRAARILIPADRRAPRERLETRSPFFLAQPAQPDARPRLLSFESDSFLDDFLEQTNNKKRTERESNEQI